MRDLILDTLSAAVVSLFGWWYMRREAESFIEKWIDKLIEKNPGMFRR
jgi:hypothetical protein